MSFEKWKIIFLFNFCFFVFILFCPHFVIARRISSVQRRRKDIRGEAPCGDTKAYCTLREEEEGGNEERKRDGGVGCKWMIFIINELNMRRQWQRKKSSGEEEGGRVSAGELGYESD